MNTYFEGGVDIEWFRDYCQFSEHSESARMRLSKQIIFNNKVCKVSKLNYSELQFEIILLLEDLKEIVIYYEMMTKSKINHFMKIIQYDQLSVNINCLN